MQVEDYRSCMSQGLKNKQLTKEERKSEFCILAKTCSGKAQTREEAQRMCAESASKPKELKASKRTKKVDYESIEPVEVTIEGKQYMLPPQEFARICQCMLKPGGKKKAKDAQALAQMSEGQKEALSIMGQMQQEYASVLEGLKEVTHYEH